MGRHKKSEFLKNLICLGALSASFIIYDSMSWGMVTSLSGGMAEGIHYLVILPSFGVAGFFLYNGKTVSKVFWTLLVPVVWVFYLCCEINDPVTSVLGIILTLIFVLFGFGLAFLIKDKFFQNNQVSYL